MSGKWVSYNDGFPSALELLPGAKIHYDINSKIIWISQYSDSREIRERLAKQLPEDEALGLIQRFLLFVTEDVERFLTFAKEDGSFSSLHRVFNVTDELIAYRRTKQAEAANHEENPNSANGNR